MAVAKEQSKRLNRNRSIASTYKLKSAFAVSASLLLRFSDHGSRSSKKDRSLSFIRLIFS